MDAESLMEQGKTLHRKLMVLDGHIDLAQAFAEPDGDRDGPGQFDLTKVRSGGVSAGVLTLQGPLGRPTPEAASLGRLALEAQFATGNAMVAAFPARVALVSSPDDLRQSVRTGQFAVILGFQNAAPLEGDISGIEAWIERGVQIVDLNFIGNNDFSSSARPYPFAGHLNVEGLTEAVRRRSACNYQSCDAGTTTEPMILYRRVEHRVG